MIKEYRLAKGWAVFVYVMAPLFVVAFGYLLIMPFLPDTREDVVLKTYWIIAPFALGAIAFCVIGIIEAAKGRFVISDDRVYTQGVFSNRELPFEGIAGFRTDDKYIYIEPKAKTDKRIKVSRYLARSKEIEEWFSERYPNLDESAAAEEMEAILSDDALGYNEQERQEVLVTARRQAKFINWSGAAVAAWALLFPRPYDAAIIAAFACPLLAVFVSRRSGSLIRVQEKKISAYPSVFTGFFLPCMALLIRSLMDFNILEYSNAWKATILGAALVMAMLFVRSREFAFQSMRDYGVNSVIAVITFAYSYGAVITLNGVLDDSSSFTYPASVIDKHSSSGKTTTYYLTLTAWGPRAESKDVSVSRSFYERLEVGDGVNVHIKKGRFDIPWFVVTN